VRFDATNITFQFIDIHLQNSENKFYLHYRLVLQTVGSLGLTHVLMRQMSKAIRDIMKHYHVKNRLLPKRDFFQITNDAVSTVNDQLLQVFGLKGRYALQTSCGLAPPRLATKSSSLNSEQIFVASHFAFLHGKTFPRCTNGWTEFCILARLC